MGLNDLLSKKGEAPKKKKQLTIYADVSAKEKMDNIQWLKKWVIEKKDVSQGDVFEEAINLLADHIGYDKLMKKHGKDIN